MADYRHYGLDDEQQERLEAIRARRVPKPEASQLMADYRHYGLDDEQQERLEAIRARRAAKVGPIPVTDDPAAAEALRQASIDHAGFHERLSDVSAAAGDVVERVAAQLADVQVGVPLEDDPEQGS